MNQNSKNNLEDQEIDLFQISAKINSLAQRLNTSIFKGIQFFIKRKIIIGLLLVSGIGLGYYLDTTEKSYDHRIVVKPNFSSVDFLYEKVSLLESKVKEGDTVFLKSIGIQNPKNIALIEIDPIVDIYTFVNDKTNTVSNAQNTQNFELVKLLAENSDINKVVKDNTTSKNYYNHQIHIVTRGYVTNTNTILPILNFLNQSEYYEKIKKEYTSNTVNRISKLEETVSQINEILFNFSETSKKSGSNEKLVYYNENTQLNDILNTKTYLLSEIGNLKVELIDIQSIIKMKSFVINNVNTKGTNEKMKFILPLFFLFIYILIYKFKTFYKKQLLKEQHENAA